MSSCVPLMQGHTRPNIKCGDKNPKELFKVHLDCKRQATAPSLEPFLWGHGVWQWALLYWQMLCSTCFSVEGCRKGQLESPVPSGANDVKTQTLPALLGRRKGGESVGLGG